MAQSVKHPTSAQVCVLLVRGFELCVGLCADSSAWSLLQILSPSLSLRTPPLSLSLSFSLSKINKHLKHLVKKKIIKQYQRGTCVAYLVEHPTLDFGSSHDLTVVMRLSP